MDNIELDCLFRKDPLIYNHYSGEIYSRNTIPKNLVKDKFYLVNTSSSHDKSIGHWVVILAKSESESGATYVDPLGEKPTQYLNKRIGQCIDYYMDYPVQNLLTTTCGMHAVVFASMYSYGFSVETTLSIVYGINDENAQNDDFYYDKKAKKFLKMMFNENRSIFYEFN